MMAPHSTETGTTSMNTFEVYNKATQQVITTVTATLTQDAYRKAESLLGLTPFDMVELNLWCRRV